MTTMQIILLIVGAGLFIASFFISDKDSENTKQIKKQASEEINKLVDEKMNQVKNHIDDAVDEAVSYSMEKTERSLERITNEKIMTVNEYSDTVLAEIHRNHEEAMFLYDMLNDKHTNLKDTVNKASQTAKEITDTAKEAEAVVNSIQQLSQESRNQKNREETVDLVAEEIKIKENQTKEYQTKEYQTEEYESKENQSYENKIKENRNIETNVPEKPQEAKTDHYDNKNQMVLKLYKDGKSPVDIARELELGVGEVKLIINLFTGKKA